MSWKPPKGRTVFEVEKRLLCKGSAWDRCIQYGSTHTIPQHAWTKAHTDTHWRWYT